MKTDGGGKKKEKEGKRGRGKGEKGLKNASLRVKKNQKLSPLPARRGKN